MRTVGTPGRRGRGNPSVWTAHSRKCALKGRGVC